jgi:hypothetical protein
LDRCELKKTPTLAKIFDFNVDSLMRSAGGSGFKIAVAASMAATLLLIDSGS